MQKLYFFVMVSLMMTGMFVVPMAFIFAYRIGFMCVPVMLLGTIAVIVGFLEAVSISNKL